MSTKQHIKIPDYTKSTVLHNLAKEPSVVFSIGESAEVTIIVLITQSIEASVHVTLTKSNSTVHVIGLVRLSDTQEAILHTDQLHKAPGSVSNLLVKSVLSDSSRFSYDGFIRVEKDAQKTDAYQRNENLLLSDSASADSKPGLEILANDVRCTHGATVSMIPPEQLWYLACRGIKQKSAEALILSGFLLGPIDSLEQTTKIQIQNQLHIP